MIEVSQLNFSPRIDGVIVNDFERQKYIKSLMQYTGIKDKNGKEIYEGDRLRLSYRYGEERVAIVRFGEFSLESYYGVIGFYLENGPDSFDSEDAKAMEVIGNIYENR